MIRTFLYSISFLGILASCSGESQEDSTLSDSGSVMQSGDVDTCQCQDLDVDSLGVYYLSEKLYTGACVQYYPNSQDKYIEKNLLDGKLHGMVTYFDRSGEILIEEMYEGGDKKRSGDLDVLTCNCDELEKVGSNMPDVPDRSLLDDIPYTGMCEKLYAESEQLYMEVNYLDGLLDGRTIYYNRDGTTLLIEKYKKGELIETIH